MSIRRALVDCAVLSLHDNTVFYPACKGCLSRIDVEQQNGARCSRCGFRCRREQLEYRYRLSLTVTRDRWIFGVTVFGTCLNSFFGIHASGLQRLVENLDGPVAAPTKAELLLTAVKNCFIGRHFIFGIKLFGTAGRLCFEEPDLGTDRVQFVATQMILPTAAGLRGCTVLRFYQLLLQSAAEHTDPLQTPGASAEVPLVSPHSPATNSSNSTLFTSALASLSPLRFQGSLTPTPPWQRSLGLVTSSAEQDEGHGSSGSDEEDEGDSSRRPVLTKTPAVHRPEQNLSLRRGETGETTPSPSPPEPRQSQDAPSSWRHQDTSCGPAAASPSRDGHLAVEKVLPTGQFCETARSDLPFSESLTEFLGEEEKETVRREQEERPLEENLWTDTTEIHSERGHTLECVDERRDCSPGDGETSSAEENSCYDCSADLFCSPLSMEKNTRSVGASAGTEPQLGLRSVKVSNFSTPRVFKSTESCCTRWDFSPQVQSTPVPKVNSGFGSPAVGPRSSRRVLGSYNRALPGVTLRAQKKSSHCRGDTSGGDTLRTGASFQHKYPTTSTPPPRILPQKSPLQAQVQLKVLDPRTPVRSHSPGVSSPPDVMCVREDSEATVPPTPAVKHRRLWQPTGPGCSGWGSVLRAQSGRRAQCKRTLLSRPPTSPTASCTTGCGATSAEQRSPDGTSSTDQEKLMCDWSRDLFSDSM